MLQTSISVPVVYKCIYTYVHIIIHSIVFNSLPSSLIFLPLWTHTVMKVDHNKLQGALRHHLVQLGSLRSLEVKIEKER